MTSRPSVEFSVVIAVFNQVDTIDRSVRSILEGEFDDFEIVVVDDGSTDDTSSVVAAIDDERVVLCRQQNRGRTAARNAGAARANGRFLAFLDGDDYVDTAWLSTFRALFDGDHKAGLVSCGAQQRRLHEGPHVTVDHPKPLGPLFFDQVGLFITGTFSVRKDLFDQANGYDTTLAQGETTELMLRLVPIVLESGATTAHSSTVLLHYEQHRQELDRTANQARLHTARTVIQRHGNHFRQHEPQGLADYYSIAGASAGALGDRTSARRYFAKAVAQDWRRPKAYARLAASCFSPVARRIWRSR